MEKRNRASGWKHAKLSGHENESTIEALMETESKYQQMFLHKVGKTGASITHIDVGGLREKDVDCIFDGEKTKSKADMHVLLDDGSQYNISIKKSAGGQVYLITDSRFIAGFEKQYKKVIPDNVKRAIRLFWGSADDTVSIIDRFGTQKEYEYHKNRLVADTLKIYDKTLYMALLSWFVENTSDIVDFCFSKGLAKDQNAWANVIWYKNELGENNFNDIFTISKMKDVLSKRAKFDICYGNRGGGTTIQLPFGFVQWHSPTKVIPGCIQFHHSYKKIKKALE